MNKKCPNCFHTMKSYTRYGKHDPNLAIENKTKFQWVCLDCGKVVKSI